jgi:spore coat polysaccharide biosynthesis protein SpsF (cytidylyltransferase family)
MKKVRLLIGIQARSTSNRLPRKHHEQIGTKRLLDHVIDACVVAREYITHKLHPHDSVQVAVLTPYGDVIAKDFERNSVPVFQGPEDDVLLRYKMAADRFDSSCLVRITGDCPLLPSFVISKIAIHGVKQKFDYLSNVDPICRTSQDGLDCEFMSREALEFMHSKAREPYDREHVTPMMRTSPPAWAKRGAVINHFDFSMQPKMSVDTLEDLEFVREVFDGVKRKIELAQQHYPKHLIMRL